MEQNIFKDDERYLKGLQNFIIRYYYYLSTGLNELNGFKNLFLGILTIYITFKLTSYWWGVGIFIVSTVILTVVGYYIIHRVGKVRDWLGLRFSSYFGRQQVNYTEESFKLLTKIADLLEKQEMRDIIRNNK